MRLTFVVKGHNQEITDAQLVNREINARLINQTKTEQVFETYPRNLEKVAQWFNETPEIIVGYGYPDGTCLIFSCHDDQECRLLDE